MNYWIFQGNPNQYDFETALKNDELIVNWLVSSHKKKIKIDDKIIVWLTGDRSGCYALAKATSDPYNKKGSSPDDHLWKTPPTVNLRVGIKITHNFVTKPLFSCVQDSMISPPYLNSNSSHQSLLPFRLDLLQTTFQPQLK